MLITNCKKGCTDSIATNFDPDAKKEDDSCVYNGDVTFYIDQETSSNLKSAGIITLIFKVDGVFAGAKPTDEYVEEIPNCEDEFTVTYTYDLDAEQSKEVTWEVKNQFGGNILDGEIEIIAGECQIQEINF